MILPLIPARGGSTGIPRKNIRPLLDGTTLLGRAIVVAREVFGWAVVSTDDQEIARAAETYGASLIWRQCPGDGPMFPVVAEALATYIDCQAVMLLQPTSPFRSTDSVAAACGLLTPGVSAVVSVSPVPEKYSAGWRLTCPNGRLLRQSGDWAGLPARRQEIASLEWFRDGSVYLSRAQTILAGSLYGDRVIPSFTPEPERLNVDDWADWAVLEAKLR